MPDFSVDSPTPVYVRVADWIESRIKSGELKPGARLPPERELARDCGVAYDTVRRAARITVHAQDERGEPFELSAEGSLAVCIQHEMDHLVGKVFVDYLSPLKRARLVAKMRKKQRIAG